MADKIGSMAIYLGAVTDQLDRDLKKGARMVDEFGVRASRVGRSNPADFAVRVDSGKAAAALKDTEGRIRNLDRTARESSGSIRGSMAGVWTIARGNLLAEGVKSLAGGVWDTVKGSIQLAGEFEKTGVAFEVMLGSADKAKGMIEDLKDFAAESPLTLSQVTDHAKKLLASGTSQGQVVPTIRALSDVSVGDPEILGRMVYAYGQVRAAGRLYGTELRQFTETGVPLIKALADALKVPEDRIKSMVEEGRIGFPDLQKAIKGLTDEGGKYAGMTEKYSRTFAGQMDRLGDAWQTVKREFGTAMIEEFGLKEAAGDVGRFTERIKMLINDARPLLKFVGDLGKGLAQVAAEGLRVAQIVGTASVEIFSSRFPETLKNVRDGVGELQNFKINPATVARFGVSLAEGIASAIETVRPYWRSFVDDFVVPIRDILADIPRFLAKVDLSWKTANTIALKGPGEAIASLAARAKMDAQEDRAKRDAKHYNLPLAQAYDIGTYQDIGTKFAAERDAAKEKANDARERIRWQTNTPERERELLDIATRFEAEAANLSTAIANSQAKLAELVKFGQQSKPAEQSWKTMLEKLTLKLERQDEWDKIQAGARKAYGDVGDKGQTSLSKLAMTPYFQGTKEAARELLGVVSARGASALFGAEPLRADKVDVPARVSELGVDLMKKLADPVAKFSQDLGDLQLLRDNKRIGEREYSLAAADLVKGLGDHAGVGQQHLPSAVEFGSQQLANMVASATGGQGPTTVEGLLAAIKDINAQQLEAAKAIAAGIAQSPVPVTLPTR